MQRALLTLLVFTLGSFLAVNQVVAQVQEVKTQINHQFGDFIRFQADITADNPIEAAVVYFEARGETRMNMGLAEVKDLTQEKFQAIYTHKISDYAIPPFSTISSYWEFILASEEVITSPVTEYYYFDNRYDWSTLDRESVRIYWYEGDRQFGEDMMDILKRGANDVQQILPASRLADLEMYIYADDTLLPTVLDIGATKWVAGRADPRMGVIILSLPTVPEQRLLAEQRIPHELMHILLYRLTENGYDTLPEWLKEGLASTVELHSNPEYYTILKQTNEEHQLLPLLSLCEAFPREGSAALRGYAQAKSFVQYLLHTYGTSGIHSLLVAYSDGMDCENGFRRALGTSLSQAERDWKRISFPQSFYQDGLQNLIPWIVILLAVLTAPFFVFLNWIRSKL